ncbi:MULTISPECIES: Urease operon accessory protein [unclassified Rhizobium]|uniref:Urease operon accessory protein n=1 Tax=unclassified Rhizobium TaxID=2613769 RepID=UPI000647E9E2|nr:MULTISPECIES: Urease operon accessory protein [unclassified Rhizobium]MBN8949270.1 Urease operon accessory protein [Rhizobium tropici]OJY75528.1 MAG: Urease operon accessory protein [Rhizobium sp. 60-20]
MIVGNGEIAAGAATVIDAADLVIRFNDCRSMGAGGSRTDVVAVCNTGRPARAMLGSAEWRKSPAVAAASEIWSVRDPGKFAALRAPLAISHPELDDFCDDYTDQFTAFCQATGKRHVVIGQSIHEGVDAALADHDPGSYVVPSSGLIVIAEVMARHPDDDIAITGFSHTGWEEHPFAAEKRLVDAYVSRGRLRRLADTNLLSASQGD